MSKTWVDKFEKHHRKIRGKILLPFVELMTKAKITAIVITNVRLILAILFILLFYNYRTTSIVLITISLLLDMIDGVLARHQGKASDRGKFLDITVDVFTLFLIVTTFGFEVYPIFIILFIVLTGFSYLFAIVKRNEYKHSDWIIKPEARCIHLQIIPIFAFYLFNLFGINYLLELLILTDVLALITLAYHYIALQIRWSKR